MKWIILLCFLLLTIHAEARLGETTQQIEARYGKPLKGIQVDSGNPATEAELYEKNGFRIAVGFYEGKSYYEDFQKINPTNQNAFVEITGTERQYLLNANRHHVWAWSVSSFSDLDAQYVYPDGSQTAIYRAKTLFIRSLEVENRRQADEKKQLEENLKDF